MKENCTTKYDQKPSDYILAFSTSNYDAMLKFLADFDFQITEKHNQLLPLFEHARAAEISRGQLKFNLEESIIVGQKAFFNLMLTDYSDAEIEHIKSLGHQCESDAGLYGASHSFQTPDDGIFLLG